MNRELYRYNFDSKVPIRDIEESLLLAVLAAESLHGRSLVRLDASFCLDSHKRSCVVDAATEVGRAIARIFTGFLTREFGEEAFKVERVGDGPAIDNAAHCEILKKEIGRYKEIINNLEYRIERLTPTGRS